MLDYLSSHSVPWYMAAAGGLIVGSVWNYWMSSVLAWQVRRRHRVSNAAPAHV